MAKHWQHKDDIKLEDVRTHEDQLRYSRMMYRRWSEIGPNEAPEVLMDLERFPFEDPTKPWMSPEYASSWARSEEEKARVLRSVERGEKRKLNRQLYRKA